MRSPDPKGDPTSNRKVGCRPQGGKEEGRGMKGLKRGKGTVRIFEFSLEYPVESMCVCASEIIIILLIT